MRALPLLLLATACNGCGEPASVDTYSDLPAEPVTVRVATYNTSFFQEEPGGLLSRLEGGRWPQARQVASVLQTIRPDVVLLNEVDTDTSGAVAQAFIEQYLRQLQSQCT